MMNQTIPSPEMAAVAPRTSSTPLWLHEAHVDEYPDKAALYWQWIRSKG